jgi:hypothetical protein
MGLDGEPDPPKLIPASHSLYLQYSTNYVLTTPYMCCALPFKLKKYSRYPAIRVSNGLFVFYPHKWLVGQ